MVFVVFLQNSYSTPPTPASVAVVLLTVFTSHWVNAGSAVIAGAVGAVVSNVIVSEICVLMLPKLSLNCIYTVFVPSHALNVCAILALHVVQFVGFALFQNATCTPPTHASVAHVVFKVTFTPLIAVALLLIVNIPQVGAVASRTIVLLTLFDSTHDLLHLIHTVFVPSHALNV